MNSLQRRLFRTPLVLATFNLFLCSACQTPPEPAGPLQEFTLVYGGDVTLGRLLNESLFNVQERTRLFGNVAPMLKQADIALLNAEGVISSGGVYFNKGEPRPFTYRAHPLAMEPLVNAGIDVVSAGNNHSMDYGPLALTEMLDRLTHAGIGYTGAGHTLFDAQTPYYQKVGDVTVAIIGADFTNTFSSAGKSTAGTLVFNAGQAADCDRIVRQLTVMIAQARKHAHLVFITPHWGDNWKIEPDPQLRTLAKKLIAGGADGIFGHSSHMFQGAELIEGKPVIYDAGNFTNDFQRYDRAREGFVWKIIFTRAGIARIEGYPLLLGKNTVHFATGKIAQSMLSRLTSQSLKLNLTLKTNDRFAAADCRVSQIREPSENGPIPTRAKRPEIRLAPDDTVIDEMPLTATPLNVKYANGIELLGYELISEALYVPKAGAIIALYWRASAPVKEDLRIRMEAHQSIEEKPGGMNTMDHIPGDWLLPVSRWPRGKIIRDWTLFRLMFQPKGNVAFYTGLMRPDGEILVPVSSAVAPYKDALIPIGAAAYDKNAPRIYDYLQKYLERRNISAKRVPPPSGPEQSSGTPSTAP